MRSSKTWAACGAVIERLEIRALLSAAYVIDGVQPASYDQPRIHALFRTSATGDPLVASDGTGGSTFDVTGFLDTGSSGIVLSLETAQGLGIQSSTFNGQTVTYEDVGVGGTQAFDVSQQLYLNLGPFYEGIGSDGIDTTNPAAYPQQFGPLRTQVSREPAPDDGISEPLDIFGIPAMQGKVVVMDTTPVNDIDYMRTWIYNPGTSFHSSTTATDPGIPATSLHVKMSNASLLNYTEVLPAGAPGPVFSSNPFIGPGPGIAGDTTPPVAIGMGGLNTTGSFLLDTGSQSAFISTAMAGKVHVYYQSGTQDTDNPVLVDGSGNVVPNQFSLTIGGIGGSHTVAGFYLDSLTLPTKEGTPIKYTHAPVLVTDVTLQDPKTGKTLTIDGDIGMNYFVASSAIAGGVGDDHPGDYTWITYDQANGVLGLDLANAAPISTGSIAGTIFKDLNADGAKNTGEGALAGVRVYLDANKNAKYDAGETSVLTDASGNYKFTDLAAGTYRVRQVVPSGYKAGTPAVGYFDVTLADGQDAAAKNFADPPVRASISGRVYNDVNADAVAQTTERGIKSWRVYLDTNNNGKLDTGETSVLTDAAGAYTFASLLPATYTVREVVQTGWRATTATSAVVTLAGVNATGRNFGDTQKAKVSGSVFFDSNKNGIKDGADTVLAGWRVFIDANNDGKYETTEQSILTDKLGNWSFGALAVGKYVIRAVQQTGYSSSTPVGGAFTLTLASGAIVTGKAFGEKK